MLLRSGVGAPEGDLRWLGEPELMRPRGVKMLNSAHTPDFASSAASREAVLSPINSQLTRNREAAKDDVPSGTEFEHRQV
jgi:hypothetical protein